MVYSPDGAHLLSGSDDRTVKVWDAENGTCLLTLTGHTYYVWSVAYSPDGKHIASASWDQSIKVWDAFSGECLRTLTGHKDVVDSVSYSPDGSRVASGSDDGSIRTWNPSQPGNGSIESEPRVSFDSQGRWVHPTKSKTTGKVVEVLV